MSLFSLSIRPALVFPDTSLRLFDLALEVLALDEVRDLAIIVVALLGLLHVLVRFGQLAEGSQGVGAELVEDAGDKLGELLVLAVAVDGEGVVGDSGVHWTLLAFTSPADFRKKM